MRMYSLSSPSHFPIVEVVRDGKQVKFYCAYCRVFHWHGDPDQDVKPLAMYATEEEMPHRGAHCHDDLSPFKHRGYLLALVTPYDYS
jgi:hypothetical protein